MFLFCSLLLNVVALRLLESTYTIGQTVINHHCCQWTKIQWEKTIECLGLQNSSGFWMTTLINNITFIWEFVYAPLTNSAQVWGCRYIFMPLFKIVCLSTSWAQGGRMLGLNKSTKTVIKNSYLFSYQNCAMTSSQENKFSLAWLWIKT